ncbi:putative nucleolar preribosomal assembly protein [Plasmodium gaboni]|uniref:Putative nucleolar preribosomal assembly protein n=1 Tax=Plasmodium gaboni TaxID=647221 RepID=A0A151LJG8_9APIC|nr:putative nucleolar preribosomal assembly protein [Plasmodium gaboni]KYN99091.1 putative nucleolar preribosomal assembly protein [Plasmodium gaboni]
MEENEENINNNKVDKEILIQFVDHENVTTGPVINVSLSITKDNLDELLNNLKKKNEDLPDQDDSEDINYYSFMINDKLPIKNSLYEAIKDNHISSEDILSIKYFPLNIFKVKKISTCTSTLPGHTSSILCLAFSPNSSHLATGSGDNTVRLWDIYTQTPIATLKDHKSWVLVVLFSPDNKFLATAGMDSNVCIYETHTGKLLNILTGHKKEVTTLCFEPLHLLKEEDIQNDLDNINKRKINDNEEKDQSDNTKKKIKIYNENDVISCNGDYSNEHDSEKSDAIKSDTIKSETIKSDTIKSDTTKGETTNNNKTNKINKKKNFQNIQNNQSYDNTSTNRSYFVRSRLASAGKDGSIRINNILNNSVDKILNGHSDTITCILWSGRDTENSILYSSSRDTTIKIWNVNEGTLIYNFKGHKHWVNCLTLNSERLLKNGIYNLDVIINKINIVNYIDKSKNIMKNFFKRQQYEKIVSGSDDGTLFLIDCLPYNEYKNFRLLGHQKPVIHTQFSPNGKMIVSSSFDKSIRVWSAVDGKFLAVYRGHVGPVYKVAWSIDNNFFVSCSQDSTLKLWKVNHLFEQNELPQSDIEKKQQQNEQKKDQTNNDTNDITNNNQQKNKVNDKEKNQNNKKIKTLLVDLPGHADAVYAVDWSNDGKFVASGGKDKVLKLWSH